MVNIAVQWYKQGLSTSYIMAKLEYEFPQITEQEIKDIVADANKIICNMGFNRPHEMLVIHTWRYNELISELLATNDIHDFTGEEQKSISSSMRKAMRERKKQAYIDCLQTMAQKEELLQLHSPEFTIEVKSETNISFKQGEAPFDLDRLTDEERDELLALLLKAKVTSPGIPEITSRTSQIETVDVTHEVISQSPNIDQIKHEQRLIEAGGTITGLDPIGKFKANLARLNAQRMKDAGFNLDKGEQKLIEPQSCRMINT